MEKADEGKIENAAPRAASVLFGGDNGVDLGDTWEWDGGATYIAEQPPDTATVVGRSAVLAASAVGREPLSYRWRREGVALADGATAWGSVISGATTSSLRIDNAQLADSGEYDVGVVALCGAASSQSATLTVTTCTPCDANCDGSVNGYDVEPFIGLINGATPCSLCAGDANGDGTVNGADIDAFVSGLLGGC